MCGMHIRIFANTAEVNYMCGMHIRIFAIFALLALHQEENYTNLFKLC
jgi:hypothetical protein